MAAPAWVGDWEKTIYERVHSLGCKGIVEFLSMFPLESYVEIAKRLGEDVAAFQVMDLHIKEAEERRQLREVAADALVRFFIEHNRRGWNKSKNAAFRQAGVFSNWVNMSRLVSPNDPPNKSEKEAVWKALKELSPPEGWVPESVDDPIIKAAFDKGWRCVQK